MLPGATDVAAFVTVSFDAPNAELSALVTNDLVTAILQDRKPLVDIAMALNMTVAGIVAHQSALKNGKLLKVPQYKI